MFHQFFLYRLGNGYGFRTSFGRNPESKGLLYVEECNERDTLLENEEPTAVYTGSTFVNGEDIRLNQYLDQQQHSASEDDSDVEVTFDLSKVKRMNQVNVDTKALLQTRDENQES